ncbi:lipopolysaccharide biosynthesis protein [Robertkochia solimangrovi]|uniref:lipopolysaccharide biosynthesis protein n=1 Tax=Robertkochia solimangrovi TaxID=2213046 RepID=UPI00117C4DED|nr:lipopolysaccharide biosynthesis protein [Robertkochia solimangrovi]TRZ45021.1 hypothetical protein DMZ48_04465 [Robertkochia solimangrovi]
MNLGNKIFSGVIWNGLDKISIQIVQFVVGVVLARLLTPNDYGIVSILLVFIAFSQIFIESGFPKALIHKQERTNLDLSSVFYFNMLISLVCYVTIWILAPFIASYYENQEIQPLMRVLGLTIVINAVNAVPLTLIYIQLDFRKLFKVNLALALLSGAVGIYFAYKGYGAWALIYQSLSRSVLSLFILRLIIKWLPEWSFSMASIRKLYKYGMHIMFSSLLNNMVNKFYHLFIPKILNAAQLGIYTRGGQFADVLYNSISSVSDSVLFPTLSTIQDDKEKLIVYTRKIIRMMSILVFPIFMGLALLAEPLIRILLTDKWIEAVPILQIICAGRIITIIAGVSVNLLYVIGRPDLALRQQYWKLGIRIILIYAALKYGIIWIAIAELISTIIHFFINTYYPGKYMKYGAFKQLKDIFPILILSSVMIALLWVIKQFIPGDLLQLIIIPVIGAAMYLGAIYLLKFPEIQFFKEKIEHLKNKKASASNGRK